MGTREKGGRSQEERPDPVSAATNAAAALTLTTTLTIAPQPVAEAPLTSSCVGQAPSVTVDWRAELKARYKAMPHKAWFKAAHQGRSLGGSLKIT